MDEKVGIGFYQAVLTVPPRLVIGRKTVARVSIEESVRVTSNHEI